MREHVLPDRVQNDVVEVRARELRKLERPGRSQKLSLDCVMRYPYARDFQRILVKVDSHEAGFWKQTAQHDGRRAGSTAKIEDSGADKVDLIREREKNSPQVSLDVVAVRNATQLILVPVRASKFEDTGRELG